MAAASAGWAARGEVVEFRSQAGRRPATRMAPADWSPGVTLLGRFNTAAHWDGTGCWLLHHNGGAAVLELPPAGRGQPTPWDVAAGVTVPRYRAAAGHSPADRLADCRRTPAAPSPTRKR